MCVMASLAYNSERTRERKLEPWSAWSVNIHLGGPNIIDMTVIKFWAVSMAVYPLIGKANGNPNERSITVNRNRYPCLTLEKVLQI